MSAKKREGAITDTRPLKKTETEPEPEPEETELLEIQSFVDRVAKAAAGFDLAEHVAKFYAKDVRVVRKIVAEYYRFMTIKLYLHEMCPSICISPSDLIDIVWHLHILHTQEYKRFCAEIGAEIHHSPLDSLEIDKHKKQLSECASQYLIHFRESPPQGIWAEKQLGLGRKRDTGAADANDIEIVILTMTGTKTILDVSLSDKVSLVKWMIQQHSGILPEQQILIFSGVTMADDKSLDYYNVKDGCVIHMTLNLKGC